MVSYSDAILEAPAYFYFRPLQAAKPPRQTVRVRAAEIAPSDLHQVLGSRPSEATRRSEESARFRAARQPIAQRPHHALPFVANTQRLRGAGGGLEPAQAFRPYGFSYPLRLSPPPFGVWGLDYPFTLARARLRCCPSSLYTFRRACGCRRLGSGLPLGEVSPTLGSSTAPVSRGALNCSSPLRLPISPRPHLASNLTTAQDGAKPKSTMRRRRLGAGIGRAAGVAR